MMDGGCDFGLAEEFYKLRWLVWRREERRGICPRNQFEGEGFLGRRKEDVKGCEGTGWNGIGKVGWNE